MTALSALTLAIVWAALASCHLPDEADQMVSQIDDVDVNAILKPNMKDPVNAMERSIQEELRGAEGKVELAMPKRLTSADEALDIQTSAATVLASRREARIQQKLMQKQVPDVRLGEGEAETTNERKARDDQIQSEVLHAIDPSLRIRDRAREPASGSSFRGMKDMIKVAMDSKMHDLGESLVPRDDIGEGIEKIVTNKKGAESSSQKKAKLKAAVEHQLADVNAQLTAAQQQLESQGSTVELLEEETHSKPIKEDADDPCAQEAARLAGKAKGPPVDPNAPAVKPPPSGCKKKIISVEDKKANLVPKPPPAKPFTGQLQKPKNANPFASKPGDMQKMEEANRGNFSKAEIDQEVAAIKGHKLSKEDNEKTKVKEHKFRPALPFNPGPKPAPGKPAKAGPESADEPTNNVKPKSKKEKKKKNKKNKKKKSTTV